MLAGSHFAFPQNLPAQANTKIEIEVTVPKEAKPKNTEEIVREYFKDNERLKNIAFCESRFRQFDKNGGVLRGVVNSNDVGVMQINTRYHLEDSKKLGLDIYTLEGNLAYGKYLYERDGSAPWNASSPCWIPKSGLAMK